MNTEQPQLPQFGHEDLVQSGSGIRRQILPKWMSNSATFLIVLAGFLGVWTLVAYIERGDPGVPPIPDIVAFIQGELIWMKILDSLWRYAVALLIGIPVGALLGMLMGMFSWVRTLMRDSVLALLALPGFVWAVLAMVWYEAHITPSVILAVVLTVAPFVTYTLNQGLQNMDPNLLKMSKSFRVPRSEQIRHIYMSGARISFFAGLRLAVIVGFNTLFILEWFLAARSDGLEGVGGEVYRLYKKVGTEVDATYAGIAAYIFVIVVMIILLDQLVLTPLERRHFLRWTQDRTLDLKDYRM